ncbi:MAG: purine-nucleoside phosphorylase [Deferribacteres bacterium]|nr:purine-nucleoside phosphorylase [candidate division KSB1 bacterium]MCB9504040.1 purine-nucleoside phosphorylase [Deferribacteres bacterium]
MSELLKKLNETKVFLDSKTRLKPTVGIILGTGLGGLVSEIDIETAIPYSEIPHFPLSTVETHEGRLLFGHLSGKNVVAMQGRFHLYEGYSMQKITFPVRLMKQMGCTTLIVSNACGGMNPNYTPGDIMVIADHINLLGDNPLIGPNEDELGPRFPDMSEPYSKDLIALVEQIALDEKIKIQKGVYVAVSGPNLETRAEYRFLRTIGADVVGMSTIPEVIVAVHSAMKVLGFSVITDACFPDALEPANIAEIIRIAGEAEPKLTTLIQRTVAKID